MKTLLSKNGMPQTVSFYVTMNGPIVSVICHFQFSVCCYLKFSSKQFAPLHEKNDMQDKEHAGSTHVFLDRHCKAGLGKYAL